MAAKKYPECSRILKKLLNISPSNIVNNCELRINKIPMKKNIKRLLISVFPRMLINTIKINILISKVINSLS